MKFRYLATLVVLAAIWGSAFMFARLTVGSFGVLPLSAVRSVVASLTLVPIMLWYGQWKAFLANWKHFIVLGLISTALPFSLITVSTQYSTAGFASILNSLTPIMSAAIAWLWLKETLSLPAVTGIGLSFLGVLVMITDTQSISAEFIFLPVLAGLGAAFFYALTGNYSRKFVKGIPPITQATGCQVFSALFLIPPGIMAWPDQAIPLEAWGFACLMGVLCTGVAFILYFYLLSNIGVARTVIVTYMIPVFGMLWGFLFLSEIITMSMTAGALLILTGIALTTGLIKGILRPEEKKSYEN